MTINGNGNGELRGAAASSAERRKAETAEREATYRAVARAVLAVITPDELRNKIGRADVLRIAGLAGRDTEALAGSWDDAERKVQREATKVTGEQYTGDPRHDDRVVQLIMRGAPQGELNNMLKEVTEEYRQAAVERARGAVNGHTGPLVPGGQAELFRSLQPATPPRQPPPVSPPIGVRTDPQTGAPVQTTLTDESVPPLGAEEVGKPNMRDVRAIEIPPRPPCTNPAHANPPHARFCGECGHPMPAAAGA